MTLFPRCMHSRNGFTDGEVRLLEALPICLYLKHYRTCVLCMQAAHEKRHLLRWWIDSSGIPVEEQRKQPALACFGERLTDPAGGWPQARLADLLCPVAFFAQRCLQPLRREGSDTQKASNKSGILLCRSPV